MVGAGGTSFEVESADTAFEVESGDVAYEVEPGGAVSASPVVARACASAAPAMLPVGFGKSGAGKRIMSGAPGLRLGRSGCDGSGALDGAGTSRFGSPSAPYADEPEFDATWVPRISERWRTTILSAFESSGFPP